MGDPLQDPLEHARQLVDAQLAADVARGDLELGAGDPCLDPGCRCCKGWTEALEALAASIQSHTAGELRLGPCSDECLVCAQIDWQGRAAAAGEVAGHG